MQIKEAYLHVIDAVNDVKLLSEKAMQIDFEIEEYAIKHTEIFKDHLDISELPLNLQTKLGLSENSDFKEVSLQVADLFFGVMQQTDEIKPCDLMCLSCEDENGSFYAFLKLNFRTSFAHAVELEENLIINKIVRQVTTLPYKSQKVEEGFLIDFNTDTIYVKDKQVTIDGNKVKYITEKILGTFGALTTKRKIDLITKTAEKVIEKFDDQPLIKTAKMRQMVTEQLDQTGSIDLSPIVDACMDTQVAKDTYYQSLNEKGVDSEGVKLNEAQAKKLKRTQRIKTASGVEIILPFEYVSRTENLSIVNHPDGSVSIELKNLGELL